MKLHRIISDVIFWLIVALAVFNISFLIITDGHTWEEISFRGMQYAAMMLIMRLPHIMKVRFEIDIPYELSIIVFLFCFGALVLGDGMDFYGRFTWWDSVLHAFSGLLLSMVALWLIHVIMAKNEKYIFFNKYFLFLFLIMFSLGIGACWEIIEFTYDSIAGTNTQQFMASTSSSLYTVDDIPLCGHDALKDTMKDLIFDLAGAVIVAVYGFIRHNHIIKRYYEALHHQQPA